MELGDRESRITEQRKRLIEKLASRSDEQLSMVAKELASWPNPAIERGYSSGLVLYDVDAHSAD